jgi:hypothetical protein
MEWKDKNEKMQMAKEKIQLPKSIIVKKILNHLITYTSIIPT